MSASGPAVNRTCPKSYLTLSAVGQVGQENDRDLTAPSWDSTSYVPTERDPVDDELLRELLPTILAQYPPETETELRAMWGDR